MTDKTEATRLADALTSVVQTYPQMSEDEPGGYCSEVDQIMDEAAALLRRWPDGEPAAPAHDGRVMVPKAPTVEMARDQSERIAALEAKNAELRAANKRAMFAMRDMEAALETERMRLVACGVVALADTPESAASARQMHDDYRSASLTDVIRRVDECIALRAALEKSRRSEHNPFETDNQSEHYERLCAALRAIEEVRK